MNSCLYECDVMHARFSPRAHRFVYRLFLFAIDLDELDELPRRLTLFSLNRPNLYSFRDSDFLPFGEARHNPSSQTIQPKKWEKGKAPNRRGPVPARFPALLKAGLFVFFRFFRPARLRGPQGEAPGLKARVIAYAASQGVDLAGGRVVLVTLPRICGYLFNPVSFYFCFDRHGHPAAAIAEVTNTFREMKPYFLGGAARGSARDGAFRLRVPKHFYVSPFSDVDVAFDFTLRVPGPRLSIQIDDYAGDERTLTSTLAGPRRELTAGRLIWFTLKYPALTLRVIALIHWHAFRLWLKRVPWFAKAARPADQRDLYRPHASIKHPPATKPFPAA